MECTYYFPNIVMALEVLPAQTYLACTMLLCMYVHMYVMRIFINHLRNGNMDTYKYIFI